jgi:hypothetical protein
MCIADFDSPNRCEGVRHDTTERHLVDAPTASFLRLTAEHVHAATHFNLLFLLLLWLWGGLCSGRVITAATSAAATTAHGDLLRASSNNITKRALDRETNE